MLGEFSPSRRFWLHPFLSAFIWVEGDGESLLSSIIRGSSIERLVRVILCRAMFTASAPKALEVAEADISGLPVSLISVSAIFPFIKL